MRYIHYPAIAISLAIGGCLWPGCSYPCAPKEESMQQYAELEVHVLTWRDYNGMEPPERALYVLDGKVVGRGENGFRKILERIGEMNQGAVLLVFPDYSDLADRGEPPRIRPYMAYEPDLAAVAAKRHVAVRLVAGPH